MEYLKSLGHPEYVDSVLDDDEVEVPGIGCGARRESDPSTIRRSRWCSRTRRASISLVQRHLRIGYNRAARLIEQMEQAGLVSAMQTNGNRRSSYPRKWNSCGMGLRVALLAAFLSAFLAPPPAFASSLDRFSEFISGTTRRGVSSSSRSSMPIGS